ncbi:hypothetical protein D3C73_1139740 [compost metagenome]
MLAPRDQRDNRLRLREAAQVLEIAVLAVDVLDIAVANGDCGSRQDGNAVGDHLRHQRLAPTGIFGLGYVAHGQDYPRLISAAKVLARARPARPALCTAAAAQRADTP